MGTLFLVFHFWKLYFPFPSFFNSSCSSYVFFFFDLFAGIIQKEKPFLKRNNCQDWLYIRTSSYCYSSRKRFQQYRHNRWWRFVPMLASLFDSLILPTLCFLLGYMSLFTYIQFHFLTGSVQIPKESVEDSRVVRILYWHCYHILTLWNQTMVCVYFKFTSKVPNKNYMKR